MERNRSSEIRGMLASVSVPWRADAAASQARSYRLGPEHASRRHLPWSEREERIFRVYFCRR